MTAELVIDLPSHASLDSMMSTIAQILQSYRTVRLEVEGRQILVEHLGRREDAKDSLGSLVESMPLEHHLWCGDLVNTMLNVSRQYNGYVVRAIFANTRDLVYKILKLNPNEEMAHVLGAEIIEDPYLKPYQLVLGLAPTYQSTIGQLREIVLVEVQETE